MEEEKGSCEDDELKMEYMVCHLTSLTDFDSLKTSVS